MPKPSRPLHTIRVALADASRMRSQLMVTAFQRSHRRIMVVGTASDPSGLCRLLRESQAHVAVISSDLQSGPISGFEAVKDVRNSYPSVRIIMTLDSCVPTMVVEAFRAGAQGVLSRDDTFEGLCKCIQAVNAGQVWANSEQMHFILDALARSAPRAPISNAVGTKLLTQREEGLVQLVSQGLTNREISRQLKLSEHTVSNYLFRIFNKLGTSNRLELALYSLSQNRGPGALSSANQSEVAGNVTTAQRRLEVQGQPPPGEPVARR